MGWLIPLVVIAILCSVHSNFLGTLRQRFSRLLPGRRLEQSTTSLATVEDASAAPADALHHNLDDRAELVNKLGQERIRARSLMKTLSKAKLAAAEDKLELQKQYTRIVDSQRKSSEEAKVKALSALAVELEAKHKKAVLDAVSAAAEQAAKDRAVLQQELAEARGEISTQQRDLADGKTRLDQVTQLYEATVADLKQVRAPVVALCLTFYHVTAVTCLQEAEQLNAQLRDAQAKLSSEAARREAPIDPLVPASVPIRTPRPPRRRSSSLSLSSNRATSEGSTLSPAVPSDHAT